MNCTPLEVKKFETLYGLDLKNKIKQWNINIEKYDSYSVMKYSYGYIDGKQIECNQMISVGKNIGKKNETTHFEQAVFEAQSKWNKKHDSGYKINIDELKKDEKGNKDEKRNKDELKDKNRDEKEKKCDIIYPMLAQDYNKHKQKLIFPAYIQPKLDGYRMIFNSKDKSCNSRQGKEFTIIKNTKLYNELMKISGEIILDGELYLHGGIFENLGILRKKKLNKEDYEYLEKIEYCIYDMVIQGDVFKDRLNKLKELIANNNFTKIKLVETVDIENELVLKEHHLEFVKNGYEGSIIRNKGGYYKCNARSTDLLKYKDFEDNEFKIVDYTYEIDTSKDNLNLIVWICETKNGEKFNVRPGGTKMERQQLYKECEGNFALYKGKNLHVKYFELTEKGVPRFPTTKTTSVSSYIRETIE